MDNTEAPPSTSTATPTTTASMFSSIGSSIYSLISNFASLGRKAVQHFVPSEDRERIERRILPSANQVLMYEYSHRQEAARKTVPVDELEEKAIVALAGEGKLKPAKDELDHAFLMQLLSWFKQSFRWVDAPPCDSCNNGTTFIGTGVPNRSDLLYKAYQVELYRCNTCSNVTRFPRYNDPLKLVETRTGRCGEWANCFTQYCRAFGYETRMILDFTDHLWTECYSPYLKRWVHLDPCEGVFDHPLLYELGWGKNLNYVIALSKDGVYDVTKRYTRKWNEVLSRRVITTEPALASVIADITKERRKNFDSEMLLKLDERDKSEAEELERTLLS